MDLGLAAGGLRPEHLPVEPAPLHVGQVIDDAQQRDQGAVRPSASLLVGQVVDLPQQRGAQVVQPRQ
jgi:hypothetical protein